MKKIILISVLILALSVPMFAKGVYVNSRSKAAKTSANLNQAAGKTYADSAQWGVIQISDKGGFIQLNDGVGKKQSDRVSAGLFAETEIVKGDIISDDIKQGSLNPVDKITVGGNDNIIKSGKAVIQTPTLGKQKLQPGGGSFVLIPDNEPKINPGGGEPPLVDPGKGGSKVVVKGESDEELIIDVPVVPAVPTAPAIVQARGQKAPESQFVYGLPTESITDNYDVKSNPNYKSSYFGGRVWVATPSTVTAHSNALRN